MNQKKIGLFLKELRKEKGITQEAFAEELNVSSRTVSRWETGSNLPDISLIVTIADYYGIDVREIIEGEKKSEMNEEIKDVANKMADYAENEKSKIAKYIQTIGFVGVLILTGAIVFQCLAFDNIPFQKWALFATSVAVMIMAIITLYVAGILEKIVKRKTLQVAIKATTILLLAISMYFINGILVVFGLGFVDYALPFATIQGVEKYDKVRIVQEYADDFDSGFFIFPDSIDNAKSVEYESKVKTGMFDSDGYFILEIEYDEMEYKKEIKRLADISCEISYEGNAVQNQILYDNDKYNYPAYIASDGYDYVYEYALLDEDSNRIIYVLLSYPEYSKLQKYSDFLKKNVEEYNLNNNTVLDNFTIYAHKFPELDAWIEYTDMK